MTVLPDLLFPPHRQVFTRTRDHPFLIVPNVSSIVGKLLDRHASYRHTPDRAYDYERATEMEHFSFGADGPDGVRKT